MNNHSNTNVLTKNSRVNKIAYNTLRIYITIYHTYILLYCKEHIQITSNDSIINVLTKNSRVNKIAYNTLRI